MSKYILLIDGDAGEPEHTSKHETYEEAFQEAATLHDNGVVGNVTIREDVKHCPFTHFIPSHKLDSDNCPRCGRLVRKLDMVMTRDCHGIPFRYVCPECSENILGSKGFDGERYDEADECIESDY